ncbi:FadR family transcriptional regulator [Bacillus sp. ISL-4]|uniref:FadR/GntR family transcriptional regulator n=1 Tax=Bacillus sp. ISL-4 TaxID=2819125 RepID=UPI001BE74994|nr:FadR/GntR family transcriptional regulator [Bacillus sp. ISL-4]MBT2668990.1 FadR family transcriptional regulator [Bacillus sp. ISL-4]MBT2671332.1 FadR family transcriptional regulator [Streptomyces sp. ISL-14]
MTISKTNRLSLVEQVVSQIESLIESGEWKIGTQIPPEMDLIQQFDVSRNTLREAVRSLVYAGLLVTKQGKGTFVRSASALGAAFERRIQQSSLLETLEVRHALEREGAQLAALRRDQEDIERLRFHLTACIKAAEAKDIKAYKEADIQLHKSIMGLSHNDLLIDLYEQMEHSLHQSIYQIVEMSSDANFHLNIHSKFVDAIIEQDVNRAIEAVNEYISQFKKSLE